MKKFLVVLLALAMILAIASTAMAADTKIPDYNDTKTSTEYANDIYRLTALGVLEGNTGWGGAYRPADNLTRAEFAKIACFMFGKQSQVNYYKAQPSAFSDVEEGFWAEGWINCANDNGLMIGIGGGKFAPQANVTKQEVATVVLRAVGYTDELPGAWPADYIAKSQKVIAPFASKTLFDYVEIIDGTAATRAEMAAIVNYALDLYRVAPAGNQLIVNGISDADADGYLYKALKTNEADIYNFFLGVDIKDAKIEIPLAGPNGPKVTLTVDPNLTTRETLLWDVFHAFGIPYLFERWASFGPAENLQYVEASGWGYEDFKKGELVFGDALTNEPFSGYSAGLRAQQKELVPTGLLIPVASDYYIFDDCLDGELWQLGGRLANLTLTVDVSKIDVLKKAIKAMNGPTAPGFLAKGVEAVYAEMLADVTYIDEETEVKDFYDEKVKVDNADIYSLDLDGFIGANLNGNYDIYDYDWFLDDQIGIVKKVADDKVTVDNLNFGDKKEAGVFCLLGDDCKKKHDLKYVFLKDNKLQDASCLKLNDVLYKAGYLAENEVALYIVYTPKAATLDELSRKSEKHPTAHMIISGDEYGWCTNDIAHQVSYDGGYPGDDDTYVGIKYDEIKDYASEDCLFAPGYGKKYVATIIFAADAKDIHFGVLDGLKAEHEYDEPDDYFAVGAKIYGVDGLEDEDTEYAVSQKFNVGNKNNTDIPSAKRYYGWLGNFELNDKGKIKIADKSLTNGVLTDPSKSGIGVPNGDDTGFVPLAPASDPITINTNDNGVLSKVAIEDIDALNALIEAKYPDEYLKHAGKSMKITKDTIIYEITTDPDPIESEEEDTQEEDTQKGTDEENAEDEAEITLAEEFAFDSVKLGDPNDYIGKEFSCNQFSIFAWDGNEITVLYVVNPHFHGDIIMGLFDTQHVDGEGDFAKYEDGTKIYFTDEEEAAKLTDHDLVYALYKTKDDKADVVYIAGEEAPKPEDLEAGDFVALVVCNGFALKGDPTSAAIMGSTDADSAKALLKKYTDGAYEVSDVVAITDQFLDEEDFMDKFTDDTEFIDMTGDGDFYDANDFHAGDDYGYIFVVDEFNEVLKVFRVDPTLKPGDENAELPISWEFGTAWDFFEDLFD